MARNLLVSDAKIRNEIKALAQSLDCHDGLSPRSIKPLTGKPKAKRLGDGEGLYLLAFADGGASHAWRFDYTRPGTSGKRNTLTLGPFPDMDLKLARERAQALREQIIVGVDPGALRADARAERREVEQAAAAEAARLRDGTPLPGSFRDLAVRFSAHKTTKDRNGVCDWSEVYAKKYGQRLERHVYPWVGDKPIKDIGWRELLEICERAEGPAGQKRELAHTLRMYLSQIWDFAVTLDAVETNIVVNLRGRLKKTSVRHMSAIVDPRELKRLLDGIDAYNGGLLTRVALLTSLYTFQRPGNVRSAQWAHVDLDAATWTIPSALMKGTAEQKLNGRDHTVPLCNQLVAKLRELHAVTGRGMYVFPSSRGTPRPMSENTVNLALRAMGIDGQTMTAHGFRATARTILAERVKIDGQPVNEAWIEAQLAHEKAGPLGAAYDRAKFLEQRVVLMQAWADYLDQLKSTL